MLGAFSILLAAAPLTIAAPGFHCSGVEGAVCDAYLDHFSTVLSRAGRVQVRTRRDLEQLLGVERQKALLGCEDNSCLAELIGGLGVEALLSGGITRTDSGYISTLRVLRSRDGAELATASSRFATAPAMEAWLEEQAEAIAEKLAPAPPSPPVNKGRVALLAGSAAVFVAGVSLFAWSKIDASTLATGSPRLEEIDGIVARGRITQPLGLTLGVVGLVALAAGLVWLGLDSEAPAASVAPVPGGGAMLSFGGRLP